MPSTTPDQLQRRVIVVSLFTGVALAFWLVPVVLLFAGVEVQVFNLALAMALCLSMCTILIGVVYRTQLAGAQRREAAAAVAQAFHADLIRHVVEARRATERVQQDIVPLLEQMNARCGVAIALMEQLSMKREGAYWDAYADALKDVGGQAVGERSTAAVNGVVPIMRVNGRN